MARPRTGMQRAGVAAGSSLLLLALAWPAAAAAEGSRPASAGRICIAPFRVPEVQQEPPMDPPTWPPTALSKFSFRIDKKLRATVARGEMALVTGVPADRKVLVEIRLDGRPFESFRLDLRKEPEKRVCLWLYEGYWHWVNTGWDEERGCRCKTGAEP